MVRATNSSRSARLLLAVALVLGACSTAQPQLNGPTGSTSGSTVSSATSSASASVGSSSGSTSGGSTLTSSAGGSTGSSGSTSSGSSATSTSGGCSAASLGGSWDLAFARLTLSQDGGTLVGSYHDWGYTDLDPQYAGTVSGTVCGSTLTGTLQAHADPTPAALDLTLGSDGNLDGTLTYDGGSAQPICGVPTGQGLALPSGCGWSDSFRVAIGGQPYDMQLTQTADEVTGYVQVGNFTQLMYGVVSDFRVNGEYLAPINGRFSFAMTDGISFNGNEIYNSGLVAWCGLRPGNGPVPANCPVGGGGGYDGSWFTNLGTITLSQPILSTAEASPTPTGVWFFWGSQTEYPIVGTTAGGLSWTDNSPVGGAVGLLHLPPPGNGVPTPADGVGVTLEGFTTAGDIWCGVLFNAEAVGGPTDSLGRSSRVAASATPGTSGRIRRSRQRPTSPRRASRSPVPSPRRSSPAASPSTPMAAASRPSSSLGAGGTAPPAARSAGTPTPETPTFPGTA